MELNHELEKLKLEKAISVPENLESANNSRPAPMSFRRLVPDFDQNQNDISLYLVLFERQARRFKIKEEDWVSHLINGLPNEILQIIARESEDLAENYKHIKSVLLKRFKLTPESFRKKFVAHQKKSDDTWKDFSFELKNYLNEWLSGLEVDTFEDLKDLLVSDQLKRRAPPEVRDHFLDKWAILKNSADVVELLDNYDDVRPWHSKSKIKETRKDMARPSTSEKKEFKSRDSNTYERRSPADREKSYEQRVVPRCFNCNSPNHLRPACPKLQKTKPSGSVSNIQEEKTRNLLAPFTFEGFANGQKINVLRDTGATLDLIGRKFVRPGDFCGENIWIKQPLCRELVCLPLAIVEIAGPFGKVKTKAAVCHDDLSQNRYLLGNGTAELIKEKSGFDFLKLEQVNAVQTRAQTKRLQREVERSGFEPQHSDDIDTISTENVEDAISSEISEPILIPALESDAPELSLLSVNKEKFIEAQRESEDLKLLFLDANKAENSEIRKTYAIENGLLIKKREDKLGNIVKLLVVPHSLRLQVKSLCHEGTSSHLGSTKSKDRLNQSFYWPNCNKDMDNYVRTCDACQRSGKSNEKFKAPLKLVPIIQEVFSRLNIDACGPLPLTTNGNRYIITAICMSSKFPEAVPVTNIGSVSVTDALLNIFSRMGFPREIQCDLGTSFVSELTTEFFDKFGIKVSHSSVHHPQSNPVERLHKTLKRLLRALCFESGADWDKHLSSILLALRTVTHESTGYTPSELVYGKNLRTPEILIKQHWMESNNEEEYVTDYVFKLINRLKRCREVSIARMEEMQIKRKLWYDRNAVKREFKIGDLVLILATFKPNKLSVQWVGPGTVRNKISETNYLVEVPGKKMKIYHVNMLKPYHVRPEHVNLLTSEENYESIIEQDLDIPYLEKNATIFDFQEITQTSELAKTLQPFQITQLRELLNRYSKCFSNDPGLTDLVEHDIVLIKDDPIRSKPYRMSQRQNEILKDEIQRMIKLGIIEVGVSDYTSPMILVETQGKDPRPCVDYRRLNKIIRTEYFPLPNIEERVEKVSSAKFITVLDLAKGYWQIPLSKQAQRYAAFCTPYGTYRPLRMSFGLKNAPFFFSKLMASLLEGLEEFATPYLDDVAIFSDTWELHIKHISLVLDRITKGNLTIKPSKCKFAQTRVKYLGHIVGNGIRSPAEAKIKCVQDFPTPQTKTQLRAFLGLAGYYGHYIHQFSVIAAPLTDALKGRERKGKINWTEECEKSFQTLKAKLTSKPVLRAPNFDQEFIVQADASDLGVGTVLSQTDEKGKEHPVLFLSRKFSEVEKRYSTTEKECASIIFAVKRLHYYLDGNSFKIVTDHNPLTWLQTNASRNPRLMRWSLALQPYDFEITHRPGKEHLNADSLSRSATED